MNQLSLNKGFQINEKYTVLFPMEQNRFFGNYRVKGEDKRLYYLKLVQCNNLDHWAFTPNGDLLEIDILKNCQHTHINTYQDSGEQILEGKRYLYFVYHFITGETLFDYQFRKQATNSYDIIFIITELLKGVSYLHRLAQPVIHNNLCPKSIMLDLSEDIMCPKIMDFTFARYFHQVSKTFNIDGIDLYYLAPECFNKLYSPQSDIFSVGAIMYFLLFGAPPWYKERSKYQEEYSNLASDIQSEREKPLMILNLGYDRFDFDPSSLFKILKKALQINPGDRFQTADEFIDALHQDTFESKTSENLLKKPAPQSKKISNKGGFSAIAGMQQLKDQLQNDVINAISNPEEYKKHQLGLPNGMLLYGPPGCGKTFFAERFAEEAGYSFIRVISSDLASIYIHGTQEKISKLFDQARKQAPTILYFDELDAMVPSREHTSNPSQSGEVNEFLSQLDNIGEAGVFVIGSTNRIDIIDKAILRSGRLEKKYFIPPPDFEARKKMFEIYLKNRPLDFGIDYELLAQLTNNYVSSDIKLIVDESSRKTIHDQEKRITMSTLQYIIANQAPSISLVELKKHEEIRNQIENGKLKGNPIGFNRS